MSKIEALKLIDPEPAPHRWKRPEPSQTEKLVDRTGLTVSAVVVFFAIFYRWPKFVLLITFPTFIPFIYFFVWEVRNLRDKWMYRVITEVVGVHCLVLAGAIYLWRTVPIVSQRIDLLFTVACGVVILESCVVASLLHFQRPKERD